MERVQAREVWVRDDAVEIVGAVDEAAAPDERPATLVAVRRDDERELRAPARWAGGALRARVELAPLAQLDEDDAWWDLFVEDGADAPRRPIGAPDDDVRNRHEAVRFPARTLDGPAGPRRLRPAFTARGGLSIRAVAVTDRPRRVPARRRATQAPARWVLPAHRSVAAVAGLLVRGLPGRRSPGASAPEGRPPVRILLMHAWGMGGTIRTTLNLAGRLAESRDVEILSIVRRRDRPFFAFPPGVTVTAVDDQRPGRPGRFQRLRGVLRRRPSLLVDPADHAHGACSLWTDVCLVRALRRVRSGALLGTRPALNMVAVALAAPGVAAVGEEHMHLSAHPERLRAEIERGYRGLDALVVLTERDLRDYRRILPASAAAVRIPNTVAAIDEPPAPLTSPTILAAGRLTPQKGFDRLIRAFAPVAAQQPDWTLRICGSGAGRKNLRRLVIEHELYNNVLLLGAVRDMPRQMAGASMFVLSSRFEGLPMVLLEAMRLGLPVVSFDCPTGPRDVVVHGETGLLVEDGDEEALGEGMLRLIGDPELRRRMGAAGRERARDYTMDVVGPQWDALLDAAVRARRGATPPPP